MKNRKISYLVTILSVIMCLITSCGSVQKADERIFVQEFGYSDSSMMYTLADVNNLEAVTELSSQAIKCEIVSLDDVSFSDTFVFNFKYSVKVLDIIMDIDNSLSIGDIIPVSSSEGILKASEAAEIVKEDMTAKKLNVLQGEYDDNEYIVSSCWDAVPIEVGKTYIMFITDRYLESEGIYSESGRSFLFEYDDQIIKHERSMVRIAKSTNDIVAEIENQAKLRTGRVDEVGTFQYMLELGERQNREMQNSSDSGN